MKLLQFISDHWMLFLVLSFLLYAGLDALLWRLGR